MKLPVRIYSESGFPSPEIEKEYIHLHINEKPVEIIEWKKKTRSLSEPSHQGRHFFFSLQLTILDKPVSSIISFLVIDILKNQDTLHLISPEKTYCLKAGANKINLISQIEHIIKTAILPRTQSMQSLEKRMKDEIKELNWVINNNQNVIQAQSALDRFITNFSFEFSHYQREFLSPYLSRIRKIETLIPRLKGEVFFFHLQQNNFFSGLSEISRQIESLRRYRYRPLMEIILNFASEVKNSNHPNLDWLHSLMVENNIMFNALLFNESPPDRENSLSRLETICRQSGGIYESVSSVDSTIQNLKKHEDQYYELAFITNRRIEEKNVRIMTVNPEEQLFYKRKYSGSEIAAIMTSIPQSKIDIKNIRVTRNKISFQLESYKKKDNQGFGLIRVRVELSTPEDHSVFQTENTLRATQDKTQVTIQIPDYKNGPLFLTITATDLISSLTRQVTHQVASRRHLPINPARGEFN